MGSPAKAFMLANPSFTVILFLAFLRDKARGARETIARPSLWNPPSRAAYD